MFDKTRVKDENVHIKLFIEDQYLEAYEAIEDAYNSKLYVGLIGPVGCGKTALCRKFAYDHDIGFSWVTFSDLIRPATLIGTFDPTLVFKFGYSIDSFSPGPFTIAALYGQIFFANEINRGDEFVLNALLDAMEEKKLYIPQLKTWLNVNDNFFFIAAMNPVELRGTRILPRAFKDRIRVWVTLSYPKKSVEMKILKLNCPEISFSEKIFKSIIDIVDYTRKSSEVARPASIRVSIGFAKLLAQRSHRLGKEPDAKMIFDVGKLVLPHAIEVKPGTDLDIFVDRVLSTILGAF